MAKLGKPGNQNIPQHQQGSILARLQKLERFEKDMLRAMNQTFNIVDQRETATEEILRAVINLLGREVVEKEVRRLKIEQLEGESTKQTAVFEEAKKEGKVVATTAVTEKSVIIGTELDKDNNQLYPVRVQLFFPQLPADYQKAYLGAKLGETVVTPTASKFTISEIYEVVVKEAPATSGLVETDPAATQAVPSTGDEPVDDELAKQLVEDLTAAAESN